MARPVDWFQRLPQIIALLEQPDQPQLLNRQSIQDLFAVERRNAQYLLARFGGTRLGNALVIPPALLAAALRTLQNQDDFERQTHRHQQVRAVLAQRRANLQLSRITLPDPISQTLHSLPSSIRLSPGHLSIEFSGTVELLTHLLELSRAIGEDFDRFEALLSQDPLSQ